MIDADDAPSSAYLSAPLWISGWLGNARRCESPNFGPRPVGMPIDPALIHSTSLPPGEFGGDAIERLFTNRLDWDEHPYFGQIRGLTVSSHFLLRRNGELVQFVSCDDRAWHAGVSAWRGRDGCNDFAVGIELEGLEGSKFAPQQYEALAWLMRGLAQQYPITAVAGHEHVAPGRKFDPGPGFDWSQLMTLLEWPGEYFPDESERAAATLPTR